MTREEQIMDIASQYAINETDCQNGGKAASKRGLLLSAFRDGAHWADSHPHWIPVEERLPKVGEEVLIVAPSEDKPMKGWLQRNHIWWSKDYACHFENITHWMPLPEAPRKEEKK